MTNQTLIILSKRWRVVLLSSVILAVVSAIITVLFPLEYRADAQVLIIPKAQYGVDPYTTVKSAENIAGNLAQAMGTSDFFSKVMNQANFNIDHKPFENISELKKREKWQDTLKPSVVYGTGVLNVSAYSTKSEQAIEIASASLAALTSQGWEYLGGDVGMKVINQPVATRFPVRPNLLINVLVGFIVGLILSTFAVVRKYRNLV